MKKYRNPLQRSVFLGCALATALLSLTLGVCGFWFYYRSTIQKYHNYVEDALQITLEVIDGEDMKACIESGTKSEKYEQTQSFLNTIKEHYDFAYIYVVKPLNLDAFDNMMNVIAGVTEAERIRIGRENSVELGELTGYEYPPEVAEFYLNRMDRNDSVSYFRNRTEFGYMYTGLVPVPDASGNPVAILAADYSMDEIKRTLGNYILLLLAAIAALSALFLSAIYRWMNRRLIIPMTRLERAANGFVKRAREIQDPNDLEYESPNIRTGDELESLSDSISAMAQDMTDFMKNILTASAEKERMGAELSVAAQIQYNMLPSVFPAFPTRKEFDLYATVTPAKEVGGDFYDFFLIDDNHLALVMADVSEKGIPAELMMVITKTIIRNQALSGKSPVEVMEEANRQLYENNGGDMLVKAWFGILELSTGTLRSVNAGQTSPAYCAARGSFSILQEQKGLSLAAMRETLYEENRLVMQPGAGLFIYTDGLIDASNAEEESFGAGKVLETLNEDADSRPVQTIRRIKKRVGGFIKDTPQYDDITMLSMTFAGPQAQERQNARRPETTDEE